VPEGGLDFLAGFMFKTVENDGREIPGPCPRKLMILSGQQGKNEWGQLVEAYLTLVRHLTMRPVIASLKHRFDIS